MRLKQRSPKLQRRIRLRRFFLFASLGLSLAHAQIETNADTPYSNGRLSLIEADFDVFSADPRRAVPFVEVVGSTEWETCKREGVTSPACPKHEWSAPFMLKDGAQKVEKEIIMAWLEFETRSTLRIGLEVGSIPALVACTAQLGWVDGLWFLLTGELFFPAEKFCDDFGFQVLPNCLLECDVPLAFCPNAPPLCLGCVLRQLAVAVEHMYTAYYPLYVERVVAAVSENLPGALVWQSPLLEPGGSVTAPITDKGLPTQLAELIQNAARQDPRALAYLLQTGAVADECLPFMPRSILALVARLPNETADPDLPGIKELERFKRDLASVESAGSTYTRTPLFWNGLKGLYPHYDRAGGFLIGEDAVTAISTPQFHACMGYAVFFHVYQEMEVVLEPYRPLQRPAACLVFAPPFVGATVVPPVPLPWTYTGPRFHTDWTSVPEGYDIPHVKDTPLY
ncbi:hypothetical protein BH24DEI2_BH24DEI2_22670 [soil metagenome]